ncbi:MAG: hypothetical protein ACOC8X_06955 [Chloroflexota bacterium]
MALGKLTFLCLNAICIGALAVVVLGAFIRMYGRHSVYTQADRTGRMTGKRNPAVSRSRTVEPAPYYMERKEDGDGRRRVTGDVRQEVFYEYE